LQDEKLTLQTLQQQILELQGQVKRLEDLIRSNNRQTPFMTYAQATAERLHNGSKGHHIQQNFMPRRYGGNPIPQSSGLRNGKGFTCYECNEPGHIARNCPKKHLFRDRSNMRLNYRQQQNHRPFVRQMVPAGSSIASDEQGNEEIENVEELSNLNGTDEQCYVMGVMDEMWKENVPSQKHKSKKCLYSASKEQNKDAEAWCNYINGLSRKPKNTQNCSKVARTVISESCPEPARNKPVIIGRCEGEKTKLFLDSGAEMNVMDCDFLNSLMAKQIPVKFIPKFSKIQCANGTQMTVTGHAMIRIEIGTVKAQQKFMVVKGLFPKVIVGIRTMKTMGVMIDPASNGIIVDNCVHVPFISKIIPQSATSSVGKEIGPFMGARKSPEM
jgi:hypothetical protein